MTRWYIAPFLRADKNEARSDFPYITFRKHALCSYFKKSSPVMQLQKVCHAKSNYTRAV